MSKLASLLKNELAQKNTNSSTQPESYSSILEEPDYSVEPLMIDPITEFSPEEYQQIKDSVAEIDMTGKTRKEIIIAMYGGIKNPKTNERFSIPLLTWEDEEYTYRYANYMKALVNRPEEFIKIMRWE